MTIRGPAVALVPGLGLAGRASTSVTARLPGASRTILLPSLGQRAPRGTVLRVEAQAHRLLGKIGDDAGSGVVLVGRSASCPGPARYPTPTPPAQHSPRRCPRRTGADTRARTR